MPKALIELREKTIKAINESSDKQAFIYKNAELFGILEPKVLSNAITSDINLVEHIYLIHTGRIQENFSTQVN